jgi:glycosyltransferase involved in cell wall biosynthesis
MERPVTGSADVSRDVDQRPVFCIVDPSLRDFVGHHFSYDHAVAHAAAAANYRTVILAHRDVSSAIAGIADVRRCFRRDMWGATIGRRIPGRPGSVADVLLASRDFHADLTAGLHGLALPPGSILFAHMLIRNQLPAIARFVRSLPERAPIDVILLLRYQSSFYDDALSARAFRHLERCAARGQRIRLATDSARLARVLGSLTVLPFEVMPIPLDPIVEPKVRAGNAAPRFVTLGDARDEKGYLDILAAIRLLRASGELDGLEFVLQSNDARPSVQAAIDAFARELPDNVTLLHRSLSPAEYAATLAGSDVVLVPYWREIYQARTSGVFLEAVAAGKIVIATRDTWMSDELACHGAGVLVEDRDPASIAAAIREVRRNRLELSARAWAGRADCLARHNAAAVVQQAAHGPKVREGARPPRRVAVFYPWTDLTDRRSGASLRTGLLVEKLAPLVDEIRVLQLGTRPPFPVRGHIRKTLWVLRGFLLNLLLPRGTRDPIKPIRIGNVEIETIPRRLRQDLARIGFRLPFRIFFPGAFGQELQPWYFLEPHLNPQFRAKIRELVAWADVVLLEYPYWASIVAPECRARGRTLIVTAHDVLSQQMTGIGWPRRWTEHLERQGLAQADHAVCVSERDREWFADRAITALVVPNPIDLDRVAPTATSRDAARAALLNDHGIMLPAGAVCLFVGSRYPPNVQAAARLKEIARAMQPAAGAAFVIAGACAEAGRSGTWAALGLIDDAALRLLYQASAIVLIPLPGGTGSSIKTIEAMAAGKPVLGTSAAFRGLRMRPGVDCLMEDDLTRWPAIIDEMVRSPDRIEAIGRAARDAAACYDYRIVFERYLPLLGLEQAPTTVPRPAHAYG